nr:MAG TPA: hypothetical protein [Caudoviricetes sp.]
MFWTVFYFFYLFSEKKHEKMRNFASPERKRGWGLYINIIVLDMEGIKER